MPRQPGVVHALSAKMLHHNHPVFDPAVNLCFELIQPSLNRNVETDYHL